MPKNAKTYIAIVIAAGAAILLFAAGSWSSASVRQFALFLGLAALASTCKVKIPGMETTMSPNFIFLLLSMVTCRFAEVVVIGLTAAFVQSFWRAKKVRAVQVSFSAAALVISSCFAYAAAHFLLGRSGADTPVPLLILAGAFYLPLNTALVAAVVALVERKSVGHVARTCYEHVFPYFIGGTFFAGLVSGAFDRSVSWKGAVVLLPIVVLGYLYVATRKSPMRHKEAAYASPAEEEELAVTR
jgi:hypothetical protein